MNFCHVEFLIKSRIFRYFTFSQPITENSQSYNREFHTVNREFRTLKANFQNSPGLKSPQNEIPNLSQILIACSYLYKHIHIVLIKHYNKVHLDIQLLNNE